jgi:hypothetical protein
MLKTNYSSCFNYFRINSQSDWSSRIPSNFTSCLVKTGSEIILHPHCLVWNLLMWVFIFFCKINICMVCSCFRICLYRMYHLKFNPTTVTYYNTKMKSETSSSPCNKFSQLLPWHLSQGHPGYYSATHASCGIFMSRMCLFSDITLHRNYLLLFMKHLAMHILTRQYHIRQQHTNWLTKFWDTRSVCL